jgi:hypothetical protein
MCLFCVCIVLGLGRGLATSWSLAQGVLPSVNDQETEKWEARAQGGCRASEKKRNLVNNRRALRWAGHIKWMKEERLTYYLLKVAFSGSEYVSMNFKMIKGQWIWKNVKECERRRQWSALSYYPSICLQGLAKARKTYVRTVGFQAEIRTGNLMKYTSQVKVMLRTTVSRPVCLGIKHSSVAYDQIFVTVKTVAGLFMWGALSDERTGLSFTTAAGPRQRSHSRVRVPWHSW